MGTREIDPKTAHDQMATGHVYIDVRTEPEFAAGHPAGAVNIPAFEPNRWGMMGPNPGFVALVQALFPAETPLLLGCKSGARSAAACNLLASAGYTDLANVAGGFHGSPMQAGWSQLGLPAQTDTEGVSHADMKARAEG